MIFTYIMTKIKVINKNRPYLNFFMFYDLITIIIRKLRLREGDAHHHYDDDIITPIYMAISRSKIVPNLVIWFLSVCK